MGRFPCIDPLAERFAWVSPYNYAENRVVDGIDWWGLQYKVYDVNAASNSTFMDAMTVQEQTTGGQSFISLLESKENIVVVYFILQQSPADGVVIGFFDTFEEFLDERLENYYLYWGTENNWKDYKSYFKEGKSVLLIGVDCEDDCSLSTIREAAFTLNHEEVAHALDKLNGDQFSAEEDHERCFGKKTSYSPSADEMDSDPQFKDTEAKKQLDEIDKILGISG